MKLNNIEQVNGLLEVVNECKGNVWLKSIYGDNFNLKSAISQYIVIGLLISDHKNELELFCDNKEDEKLFLKFFKEFPETC